MIPMPPAMHDSAKETADRRLGAALDDRQVVRMREALSWLRARSGIAIDDIAHATGAGAESLRNFIYRTAQRPDNALLGTLLRYLGANADQLPRGYPASVLRPLLGGVEDALRRA